MPPPGSGDSGGVHQRHPRNGGVTPHSWAVSLLQALGAPQTKANVDSIVSWEAAEGGNWRNTATYDPLNTTQVEPGSTPVNPIGVQAYTSWSEGLNATVTTLHNGDYNDILGALRSGKGLLGRRFEGLSDWSGGNYDSIPARTGYGGGPGRGVGQIQTAAATPASCAVSLPSYHLFFFFGPSVGGQCLLPKSNARAVLAIASLSAGGFIMALGLAMIFGQTRPVQAVTSVIVGGVRRDFPRRPPPRRPRQRSGARQPPAAPAAQGTGQAAQQQQQQQARGAGP